MMSIKIRHKVITGSTVDAVQQEDCSFTQEQRADSLCILDVMSHATGKQYQIAFKSESPIEVVATEAP